MDRVFNWSTVMGTLERQVPGPIPDQVTTDVGCLGSLACPYLGQAQGLHPQCGPSSSGREVPILGTEAPAELGRTFTLMLHTGRSPHCLMWGLQVPVVPVCSQRGRG